MASHLSCTSNIQKVDCLLNTKETILHVCKKNLILSQNRMKQQVDQHFFDRSFEKRNHVFLHLQTYNKIYIKANDHQKLESKFYGLYKIL
jgi:hypothetical protein